MGPAQPVATSVMTGDGSDASDASDPSDESDPSDARDASYGSADSAVCHHSVKATVENSRGSVEKLSPKESVEGGNTKLRGSVRAPKRFSEGKPQAAKQRGRSPRGFAAFCLPKENPKGARTLSCSAVWANEVSLLTVTADYPQCE